MHEPREEKVLYKLSLGIFTIHLVSVEAVLSYRSVIQILKTSFLPWKDD